MSQKLKFHGATLNEGAIEEFYPDNSNFKYFLFQHVLEPGQSDHYYLKVYAINKNGDLMKEVIVSKDNPNVPLEFSVIWLRSGVEIGREYQLDRLDIPTGQKIKTLQLIPQKYKDNYVGYRVKIKIGNEFAVDDEEINPSPPATNEDNEW